MSEFVWVSLLLSLLALGFAIMPLCFALVNRGQSGRDTSNVQAYKARLSELEQESEFDHYSDEERRVLKQELELRLLEEVDGVDAKRHAGGKPWLAIALVILILPVGAWFLYQEIGAKSDYDLYDQLGRFQRRACRMISSSPSFG